MSGRFKNVRKVRTCSEPPARSRKPATECAPAVLSDVPVATASTRDSAELEPLRPAVLFASRRKPTTFATAPATAPASLAVELVFLMPLDDAPRSRSIGGGALLGPCTLSRRVDV